MLEDVLEIGSDGTFDISSGVSSGSVGSGNGIGAVGDDNSRNASNGQHGKGVPKSKLPTPPSSKKPNGGNDKAHPQMTKDDGRDFKQSNTFTGKVEGFLFKNGEKGMGYYKDDYVRPTTPPPLPTPPPRAADASKIKKSKKGSKRLLDPSHPAFAQMTPDQVEALETMLKMKPEELKHIPEEQRAMVEQFRTMYKENPGVFAPKGEDKKKGGGNDEKEKEKEKGKGKGKGVNKKEHDPLKWLADQKASLEWFVGRHIEFDREGFLEKERKEKEERARKEKEEREAREARSRTVLEGMKVEEVGGEGAASEKSKDGVEKGMKQLSVDDIIRKKEDKKRKNKEKQKKKDVKELMSWAS